MARRFSTMICSTACERDDVSFFLPPRTLAPARHAPAPPPPPPPRTKWTRRVPHPVLIGHAASLTPY